MYRNGSLRRAAGASVGLLLTGAAVGAALAVGVLAVWGRVLDGPGGFPYVWDAFELAGVIGAALGGVLLPLTAWTILPHVSFGRIVAETSVGALLGAVAAIVADTDPLSVPLGALAGFGIAVLQLRLRRPRKLQSGQDPTHQQIRTTTPDVNR
jgi:hypothetical protein